MFLNVIYIHFSENLCSVRCHPTGLFNVRKYYHSKTCRESQVNTVWIKISRVEEGGCVVFFMLWSPLYKFTMHTDGRASTVQNHTLGHCKNMFPCFFHYIKSCFTAGVSETPKSDAMQTRLYAILIKLGKVRNLCVIKQCHVCVLRCQTGPIRLNACLFEDVELEGKVSLSHTKHHFLHFSFSVIICWLAFSKYSLLFLSSHMSKYTYIFIYIFRCDCMYDCQEGAAYGQTNRPNPVITEKTNAYPLACDLRPDLCIHCTWPHGRLAVINHRANMSHPAWDETHPGTLI